MVKDTIQVTIVNGSRGEECDAECGIDWSSAEAVALVKQRIKNRFGDRARLEYIDLSQATNSHRVSELRARTEDMPLPSLLINGQPRISGQFDVRRLLDAIEAEMEMGA